MVDWSRTYLFLLEYSMKCLVMTYDLMGVVFFIQYYYILNKLIVST